MLETEEDKPAVIEDCKGAKFPALDIDWDYYMGFLEESDLSHEQKEEFVGTLWNLQLAWVDLWLGIHPVQQACEQNRHLRALLSEEFDAVVDSPNSNNEFEHAAGGSPSPPEKRSQ